MLVIRELSKFTNLTKKILFMICVYVKGSCVYYSIATALEAAYRIAGVEVEELAWEELYDMVDECNPRRTTAALRVLKYRGIHKRVDYKKVNSFTTLNVPCFCISLLLNLMQLTKLPP